MKPIIAGGDLRVEEWCDGNGRFPFSAVSPMDIMSMWEAIRMEHFPSSIGIINCLTIWCTLTQGVNGVDGLTSVTGIAFSLAKHVYITVGGGAISCVAGRLLELVDLAEREMTKVAWIASIQPVNWLFQ